MFGIPIRSPLYLQKCYNITSKQKPTIKNAMGIWIPDTQNSSKFGVQDLNDKGIEKPDVTDIFGC